eukprot:g12798.t1
MFSSALEAVCPALKLGCLPHIGHFNDGQDYKLARLLSALRFNRDGLNWRGSGALVWAQGPPRAGRVDVGPQGNLVHGAAPLVASVQRTRRTFRNTDGDRWLPAFLCAVFCPLSPCLEPFGPWAIHSRCSSRKRAQEPHEKMPSEGFDLLMRKDRVKDLEVVLALYDMQERANEGSVRVGADLRDWLYKKQFPYVVNLLFHSWLFDQLPYRKEASTDIEVAIFGTEGVFPMAEGLGKSFRAFPQSDKVYMCMGPDVAHFRVDRQRLVTSFWSLCIPAGQERGATGPGGRAELTGVRRRTGAHRKDASISNILHHLQKLLLSVQGATHRLSRLMGRCEGAFDGICLDDRGSAPYKGATEPMQVWEEQLNLLDRTVEKHHTPATRPAPLLSEMLRRRVYEDLGRRRREGKFPWDDDETIDLGHRIFLTGCSDAERAQVVHRVLIECIQDLERLAESNAELLAVEGGSGVTV